MTSHSHDAPSDALRDAEARYEGGRYRDALRVGPGADLRGWPTTHGRVLAARLAHRLGAPRLSQALFVRAYRDDPTDAEATYFMASLLHGRRGPWHALEWLAKRRGTVARTADILGLEAVAFAGLRDFERAEQRLAESEAAGCRPAWLATERAHVLETRDRIPEALEVAEAALARWPGDRPLLGTRASLLSALGRAEEALDTLRVPATDESWELLFQRADLASSIGDHAACEADLVAAREVAVLLEPRVERMLAATQAEAAYLRRAHRRAEGLARAMKTPFGDRFAEALVDLEDGAAPPRVELPGVPHIRQHHVTCMPASLAIVAAYHGDPVDHVEVADAICYAGTPLHRAVAWARERGWAVRQLDVDLGRARALIDAGFPIVLSTAGTAGAHSNVIFGYDLARRSLLIRDPGTPTLVEVNEELLAAQAWFGPHGLVLAPPARAAELEAMDLGESSALLEASRAVAEALDAHDVAAARAQIAALEARAPAARETFLAKLSLARYEGRVEDQLAQLDALLALHPDTTAWVLQRGEAMRGMRPLAERLALWSRYVHLDDPALLESLAEDLRHEYAEQPRAKRLLRRALRLSPASAMAHHVLADLRASRGEDDLAVLESYRFGACLALANDHFLEAYFQHARACGRDEEALALLHRLAEEAEDRATGPARVLFSAYLDAGLPERGVELLEALAALRPTDGDLALVLVHAHRSAGNPDEAAAWLAKAGDRAARAAERALAEARVARDRGDLEAARDALERGLTHEPTRLSLLEPLADVLLELEGHAAALDRVAAAHALAPDDGALLGEHITWLRGRDDARALALVRARVEARPNDHWARRELALRLAAVGDLDAAIEAAHDAVQRTPFESVAFGVLGDLLAEAHDLVGARAALRRAVELSIDNEFAIRRLSRLGLSPAEAREDARFVLDQMGRRVSRGGGLIEAAAAAAVLPHDERIARLEELLSRAPHRPDAWEVVIRSRLDAGGLDEARDLCLRAVERFPRWFHLRRLEADVHRLRGEPEDEERVLTDVIALSPSWGEPRVRLSTLLRARGADAEARALVEEGLRRAPRVGMLATELALLEWRDGDRGRAFDTLSGALERDVIDDRGLELLMSWGFELGRADETEARLRAGAERASKDAHPWFRLARAMRAPERVDERITALRETLRRAPRHADAADLLAATLADVGRHEEALAACPPEEWQGPVPHTMRGRRAWVLDRCGRTEEAIEAMRQILAEAPDYSWGRRQLCDMLDRAGRPDEFLAEAEQLVREEPTAAVHYVYRADARRLTGDIDGARADFARALELDPAHAYAATELLGLRLAAGELAEAAALLDRSRPLLPDAEREAAATRIAAAERDWPAALEHLRALTDLRAGEPTYAAALRAFAGGPFLEEALEIVEGRLIAPDAAAGAPLGYVWVDACKAAGLDRTGRLLRRRGALGPAGQAAIALHLEELGMARGRWRILWLWMRHGRWIRGLDGLWGSFGYALFVLGWMRLCLYWLRDHATREGARPWMLDNLVAAAWWLGRRPLAESVTERALALPRDHGTERLRVWSLFHRALAGEPIDEDLDVVPARGEMQGVLQLTRALQVAQAAGDLDDEAFFEAVRAPVEAAVALEATHGLLLEPIHQALDRITEGRPGLYGRLRG